MPSPFPNLPPNQRGTLHTLRFDAPSLHENPWSDPSELPRDKELNPFLQQTEDDPHDELAELFAKVERSLSRIDGLLSDASAGDTEALAEIQASGIDDIFDAADPQASAAGEAQGASSGISGLLRHTQGRGQQVIKDIDRILEIAQQSGST